jgi:hypothetical protein
MKERLDGDFILCYRHIGIIFEDEKGTWEARDCDCSGYIDEYPYDAVITHECEKHKGYRRIAWDEKFEIENLGGS